MFFLIFNLFVIELFSQTLVIDSLRVLPQNSVLNENVNVKISCYINALGGGCTYSSKLDSVTYNTYFISGTFDSNAKCLFNVHDTLLLGKLESGQNRIIYSVINSYSNPYTIKEIDTVNFSVLPIDSVYLKPVNLYQSDSVYFFTSLGAWNCGYNLEKDSIKSNIIYVSGKYDSYIKCLSAPKTDSINLGILASGDYKLKFSFKDYREVIQTGIYDVDFRVNATNNVANAENVEPLFVYPNPTKGYLQIENNQFSVVEVYSANSNLLKILDIRENGKIDISYLPKGLYILKLKSRNGIHTTKIIKE